MVAKVNGDFWDLFRPMEADCKLQIFTFNDDEGKYTYWHSTAHVPGPPPVVVPLPPNKEERKRRGGSRSRLASVGGRRTR